MSGCVATSRGDAAADYRMIVHP